MFHCYKRAVCFFLNSFFFSILFFLLTTINSYSAQVTLAWNANTESSLRGYKVYYGDESRPYQFSKDAGLSIPYTVVDNDLVAGKTYYFVVVAYDENKSESGYSNKVAWTVPTANSSPVANSDSAVINQNTAVSISVLGNDSDPDGDTLSISSVSTASHGTTSVSGSNVLYIPSKDYYGTDSFSYTVTDGRGGTATATVSVTVNRTVTIVNKPPVAVSDSATTTQNNTTSINVLGNDSDPDGDTLSISSVGSASHGTTSDSGSNVLYTPSKDYYGTDSFSYTVTDGRGGTATATVNVTVESKAVGPVIETGRLDVDSNWKRVSFTKVFSNPAVVAKPASFNDSDPCVVRIQNIDSTGFEIKIQEWDYLLDGIHGRETVDFIAMEQGSYSLPDGTMLEAGQFQSSNVGKSFASLNFNQPFTEVPVLLASVASYNEYDAVTTRLRNITTTGFQFVMQEQESRNRYHALESVCYIAWEPSSVLLDGVKYQVFGTGLEVGREWHPIAYPESFNGVPKCIADFQTVISLDTIAMRYHFKDAVQMEVKAEEEASYDAELYHPSEAVGMICVEDAKGLVAAYNFDEGSGTILYDRSGNSNNGDVSGATWNTNGKFGRALSFDGVNDWVTIKDSDSLDLSTGMTLEAWVYPHVLSGWQTVILKEGTGDLAYALYANTQSNVPGVFVYAGGEAGLNGVSPLPVMGWTHFAGTYDGTTLKLYVNGVQVKALPVSQSMVHSSNPLRIGGDSVWGEYFHGLIDEVRIYNRPLSQSEIASDMNTSVGSSPN